MVARNAAATVLTSVTCALITRTVRGIRSEVEVGPEGRLSEPCAVNCDNLITVPISRLDPHPAGRLGEFKRAQLDRALRYALDIVY